MPIPAVLLFLGGDDHQNGHRWGADLPIIKKIARFIPRNLSNKKSAMINISLYELRNKPKDNCSFVNY